MLLSSRPVTEGAWRELTLVLRRPQLLPGLATSSRRCWTLQPLAAPRMGPWLLTLPLLPQAAHVAAACGGLTDHFADTQVQSVPLAVLYVSCCCVVWEKSYAFWLALHHGDTCRCAVAWACCVNGNNRPWGSALPRKA